MAKFDGKTGIVTRDDGHQLKTKIVATIGHPARYGTRIGNTYGGITDLQGRSIAATALSRSYLVQGFLDNGVDVIRVNLSHADDSQEVKAIICEIKSAILEFERTRFGHKLGAILIDLPGPKIRFDNADPIPVETGDEFIVEFDRRVSDGRRQTVYVDRRPLKQLMDRLDSGPSGKVVAARGVNPRLAENVLGCRTTTGSTVGRFERLMIGIGERLKNGEQVLVVVGDGDVVLEVDPTRFDALSTSLACHVTTVRSSGGAIGKRKGFTIRGSDFDVPSFTETDAKFLTAALEADYRSGRDDQVVAFVGLSFAQTAHDVLNIRELAEQRVALLRGKRVGSRLRAPAIIAKVETSKGWRNRNFILDVADGVMVARGDLGLQMKIEEVPAIQKGLTELCNARGKPVITATEMLKSMTDSVEPTRAETTDVFNAVEDGSDAVMTSDETAVGRFPFHTLRKMVAIAEQAERHLLSKQTRSAGASNGATTPHNLLRDDYERIAKNERRLREVVKALALQSARVPRDRSLNWRGELYEEKLRKAEHQRTTNRITEATCTLADVETSAAIVATSTSGRTVRMISRLRPLVPVIGAVHDQANARKLLVSFGVYPICIDTVSNSSGTDALFDKCVRRLRDHPHYRALLHDEATLIFTAGTPLQTPGTTNLLHVKKLPRESKHLRKGTSKSATRRPVLKKSRVRAG